MLLGSAASRVLLDDPASSQEVTLCSFLSAQVLLCPDLGVGDLRRDVLRHLRLCGRHHRGAGEEHGLRTGEAPPLWARLGSLGLCCAL